MVFWSSLNRSILGARQAANIILGRFAAQNGQQVRGMSGHNVFHVTATRWQWHKFKDYLHFYTLVGLIPLGAISAYANLFIGPAELAPIPEGYVPKEWEYYRHPITRFFKKYIMESEQEAHERHLHYLWEIHDKAELRRIEKDVFKLQQSRADYQSWYYIPVETKIYESVQQDTYEMQNERGV